LQSDYVSPNRGEMKWVVRSLISLASVRPHEVPTHFDLLLEELPEDLPVLADYNHKGYNVCNTTQVPIRTVECSIKWTAKNQ
jgi:hypothetical protein